MTSKKKRSKRTVGDVVAVPLGQDDLSACAIVLDSPLMAFMDRRVPTNEAVAVEDLLESRVLFRLWVAHQPILSSQWPVVGHVAVPAELREPPWFFNEDPISGEVTIGRTGAERVTPAPGQLEGLERAAVWSAGHVVDRLRDHFAGRQNRWVEAMRVGRHAPKRRSPDPA